MFQTIVHWKGGWRDAEHGESGMSPTLMALFQPIASPGHYAIDLGCGTGDFTFRVAPQLAHVIGIDRDAEAVESAQEDTAKRGMDNVTFFVADAERVDYREFLTSEPYDLVTAHLCLSPAMVEKSCAALRPGGRFLFCALESGQWQETGAPSRYAFQAQELRRLLEQAGFDVEYLGIETDILEYASPEELARDWLERLPRPRWMNEARSRGLSEHVGRGGQRITARSHLIGRAQKRRPA
ncbi:MAG: class I SAM-dependent methyltransferase [Planctomycetes bacterium]|nr:class I SAM-dependent methyltransferase [Planctomycetota bacterium]